ncbi:NAD-dependent epimerase/dehydratase [Halogeometricum pallidum JCM 14848]|uniref:NAD-dependent epimerase/dehydratase n=1 Tax=Halogeometricum pallidum JCM 14848 TaxID=1227487 RepID=M0DCY2_HALPD|nr:NAD-dependent epimerase/dehydratase [Halogeometricum pallidum JCM 14848]
MQLTLGTPVSLFGVRALSSNTLRVLLAGAHGQVGQHAAELLGESDHDGVGMVRAEDQVSDIEELGIEAVVADLTEDEDVSRAVEGVDAVVFAAGSGGDDVWGVDRDGAIRLMEACESAGVDRFVMLSSMNADAPEESPEALREYLRAKAEADERLRESDLTYTVVRPGALTNEEGTGRIRTGADIDRKDGDVPRVDVAQTLLAALEEEATYEVTFEMLSGDVDIEEALSNPLNEG